MKVPVEPSLITKPILGKVWVAFIILFFDRKNFWTRNSHNHVVNRHLTVIGTSNFALWYSDINVASQFCWLLSAMWSFGSFCAVSRWILICKIYRNKCFNILEYGPKRDQLKQNIETNEVSYWTVCNTFNVTLSWQFSWAWEIIWFCLWRGDRNLMYGSGFCVKLFVANR